MNYKKRMTHIKLIILFMLIATVFVTIQFHYGMVGLVLNGVILFVMFFLIRYADKHGLGEVYGYTEDIDYLLKKVREIEEEYSDHRSEMISEILELDNFLHKEEVKEQYQAYCRAYKKETLEECSISYYLNYDRLTENLSLRFCEILPSILTALGILGTFIGLAFGLTSFDYSSSDAMARSIQTFVSGINVAFYTSIYGIVLSIFMNGLSNAVLEKFEEKLIVLEQNFENLGMNRSKNNIWLKLYEEERNQTTHLNQLNSEFPKHLADTLGTKLSKSFNLTNSNIQNLMGQIQERENHAMEIMVQNFLDQLTQSVKMNYDAMAKNIDELSGSFQMLNQSVGSLSKWQKEMTQEIQKFVSEIEASHKQMEHLTEQNAKQMERFNEILADFSSTMEGITGNLEQCYQKEEHLYRNMEHVVEQQDAIADKLERVVQVYEINGQSLNDQSKELEEKNQGIEGLLEETKKYQEECKQQLLFLTSIYEKLEKEKQKEKEDSDRIQNIHLQIETLEWKTNHIIDHMRDLSRKQDSQKLMEETERIKKTFDEEIQRTQNSILQAIENTTLKGKIKKVLKKTGEE